MTIIQGDCGGMTFRYDDNGHFYKFSVCQNGIYKISKYISETGSDTITLQSKSSATINPGLGQQNKIAVVALGKTLTFYVNEQQIDQEQDSSYTSGKIELIANPLYGNVTDVTYTNAQLWMR